jgi:hypothetical protein
VPRACSRFDFVVELLAESIYSVVRFQFLRFWRQSGAGRRIIMTKLMRSIAGYGVCLSVPFIVSRL